MGQLLRINFENKDHTFRILNTKPISRETKVIDLTLDGQSLTIIKDGSLWVSETLVEGVTDELIKAIAKNITLRFRI
ncbi:MAG: hypothetical protein JKY70_18935 [Mucilaginibacter sp.]|nr:hypothetical protein [Mucilaginibacter sp.]